MKQPESWDESDLLQLISSKQEESIQLDFKRADSLTNKGEIGKDVSAFANSSGGTIVYGIEEAPEAPHEATRLSPIDPGETSKEWLEQVINSRIQPRIAGIVINPIETKSVPPGRFAYVVVIPESNTAHQASDKRYYKRFNFESVPMEDYEVRQTMNRASRPSYRLQLHPANFVDRDSVKEFRFGATIENQSEIAGHEVSAVIFVPRDLVQQPDDYSVDYQGVSYSRIAGNYVPSSRDMLSAIPSAHPLTPYAINFKKTIRVVVKLLSAERFTVLVKVFDQFGLALTSTYHVRLPGCDLLPVQESPSAKRSAGIALF